MRYKLYFKLIETWEEGTAIITRKTGRNIYIYQQGTKNEWTLWTKGVLLGTVCTVWRYSPRDDRTKYNESAVNQRDDKCGKTIDSHLGNKRTWTN